MLTCCLLAVLAASNSKGDMLSCKLRAATEGGRASNLGAVPPLAEVRRCAFACVPAVHDPLLCTPSAGMPLPDGGSSVPPVRGTIVL